MTDVRFVRIGHPYVAKVFPHDGEGKILGNVETFRMTTDVAIREGDSGDYPVAVSLSLGDGRIEVRHGDGSFWRPLLAPGTLTPLSFAAFEDLADGSSPWRDSPFLPRFVERFKDGNKDPKPLIDGLHEFHRRYYRKIEDDGSAAAARIAQAAASDLLVIDGVVHLRCPEPTLMLKTTKRKGGFKLTWRLPRLEGDDDVHGATSFSVTNNHGNYRYGRGAVERPSGPRINFRYPWRLFPIACLPEAIEIAGETARRFGRDMAYDEGMVQVHRADLLTSEIPELSDETSASAVLGHLKGIVTDLSKAAAIEWLEARERLSEGNSRAALDHLRAILDMPEDSARLGWDKAHILYNYGSPGTDPEAPFGILVRHAVLGRTRDLDARDEAALADLGLGAGPLL